MMKHIIKRFYTSIKNKMDPDPVLTEDQEIAFNIFSISLYDDDNIRYLNSDQSDKRYIVTKTYILNKEVNTFIVLEPNIHSYVITIVNHQYKYSIPMPPKTFLKMVSMFNEKVEKDREVMEKEIMSNITKSLDLVLKELETKGNI